jgi:hypothetical protein
MAPPRDPPQSSIRGGRFDLRRTLGEGGLGVVYEAYDRTRDTWIALKKLRRPNPETITRLKREFRALEDLQHPNLVTLHELFEEHGQWFFTMELVQGVDFYNYVRRSDADNERADCLDEERLRSALGELSSALLALHSVGKIHRDVKPSNALVTAEGRLVLLDFGLVTEVHRVADWTSANAVGTVRYMAPEQAAGRPVGPEADWYAVGSMLYEALTGCPPFDGSSLNIMLDKQRRVPVAPNALLPLVASDLSELCMELLRIDPARRPPGSSVLERLRGAASSERDVRLISPRPRLDAEQGPIATAMTRGSSVFVGREAELAFLDGALSDVRRGEQVSVYLQGESGIGKSELIRAFARGCAAQGVIHLHGRCHERETVAYKAVDGVMEDLSGFMRGLLPNEAALFAPRRAALLLRVFPALTRVSVLASAPAQQAADPQELRAQLFEAFRDLFFRLCERHTILITIEDLQWSDRESLALLAELLRKPGAPPLLFIASWRSADAGEALGLDLDALPRDARALELGRLSPASAHELARNLLTQSGGDLDRAQAVAEAAGGHPILIDELARFTALSRLDPTAVRVEDALWSRIEKLGAGMRAVLELYAIASAPLPMGVVARAARLGTDELSRHVSALRMMRLLRTSSARQNQTTELYHDSVRRAVLAHLDAELLRTLHGALADALRTSGQEEWEALAIHYQGAGAHEQAANYFLRGAEQAEHALAFAHAARLYERTLSLWPADHPERRAVQIRMGEALGNAGFGLEAAHAFTVAAAGDEPVRALELTRRAAQQLLLTGHVDEGLARLDEVLRAEGIALPRTPARALASILYRRSLLWLRGLSFKRLDPSSVLRQTRSRADVCWRVGVALVVTDHMRGQGLCLRALSEALRTGDAYYVARALGVYAGNLSSQGTSVAAKVDGLLDLAHALANEADSPHALGIVLGARGQARYLCGSFRAAVQYSAEAERLFRERCVGVPWELDTARLWSMRSLLSLGEYAELTRRLPAMLDECRQREDLYGEVSLRASIHANSLLARDRPDEALADIAATEHLWSPVGYHVQHFYFSLAKASIALYAGRHAEALAQAGQLRREASRTLFRRVQTVRVSVQALYGRSLLAGVGNGSPAASVLRGVEDAARSLERERAAWASPQAQLLRAAVARLRGRTAAVVAALREALAGFEAVEMRVHAACTGIRLGRCLGGEEGAALVAHGQAVLETQGIAAPARFLELLAPGFAH